MAVYLLIKGRKADLKQKGRRSGDEGTYTTYVHNVQTL